MASSTSPSTLETVTAQLQATPADPSTMAAQLETNPMDPNAPLPEPIATTSRLIIRPMHPQDAPSYARAAGTPLIAKYMSLAFPSPYTLEHSNGWIKLNLTDKIPNYVIAEKDHPDVVIGGMGFKPGADVQSHAAELGYWIGEDWWGKGYMQEALAGLTEYGFESGRWSRLWANVFSENQASVTCLEKCGYKLEGVLKGHVQKHGEVSDLHVLGLTIEDWRKWKQSKET
ncbi:acyl-CoA N-acyltransferase [Aaosphaeria arxii CBS 175.79]|uniref:Acyl-CoA N-acyltransferase n=1 Tax=Aaosphaeria arxii CBS 175.79 TaxID=1450172 RepID=A0A6A5XYX7_9PLEO|nr:acyl-CoA N-acyltransferase [Aaosphaeria arxii CBS 175.79]KAF2018498.1 acyl-CoA N-acyltransferase [Aaosphaeria arxii CBS 175.79]